MPRKYDLITAIIALGLMACNGDGTNAAPINTREPGATGNGSAPRLSKDGVTISSSRSGATPVIGGEAVSAGRNLGLVIAQGCHIYVNVNDQSICSLNSVAAPYSLTVRTSSASSPANQPIVVMPRDGTAASITLNAVGTNAFAPLTYTWAQVTPEINNFASTAQATFSSVRTTSPSVQVRLPTSGMYQFKVTAVSADKHSVSQYVWVNAWEYATAEAVGKIGRNPGLTPPQSVRQLSADPGPFNHPRLFFSKGDWAELNAKIAGNSAVPEALIGVETIRKSLAENLDKPGTAMNNLAIALTGYAAHGYQSAFRLCGCPDPAEQLPYFFMTNAL